MTSEKLQKTIDSVKLLAEKKQAYPDYSGYNDLLNMYIQALNNTKVQEVLTDEQKAELNQYK